jgi:hypothetical protein
MEIAVRWHLIGFIVGKRRDAEIVPSRLAEAISMQFDPRHQKQLREKTVCGRGSL